MQHGHMLARLLRVVCIVRPCVNLWRFRMADQLEYFYDSIPNSLALKHFFYGHTLNMLGFDTMQATNYVPQFLDVITRHLWDTQSRIRKRCFSQKAVCSNWRVEC